MKGKFSSNTLTIICRESSQSFKAHKGISILYDLNMLKKQHHFPMDQISVGLRKGVYDT